MIFKEKPVIVNVRKVPPRFPKKVPINRHKHQLQRDSRLQKSSRRHPVALQLLENLGEPKQYQIANGDVCVSCKTEFVKEGIGLLYRFKAREILPNGKQGNFLPGNIGKFEMLTCASCEPPKAWTEVWAIRWPTRGIIGTFVAYEGSLLRV